MSKEPSPYTGAPCITEAVFSKSRVTRTHPWDYLIVGETKEQRQRRHTRIKRLCQSCPALDVCEQERQDILSGRVKNPWTGEQIHLQGVIWAGRAHPDKEPEADKQDALMSREGLAA
ncbi:hypothetical protein IU449_26970 [Nocardia higoensis]|uniref:4Fe-4S Wbl-type domain-containing protein n=1 Tax=Nocardia higoensis TaxID=228599 RepID=A0ABS0DJP6_9NOCA|nr:hypothetical protein [Nocardia higoensis]MBF6358143.1 hypothetical protein [Nocardia higoensis]